MVMHRKNDRLELSSLVRFITINSKVVKECELHSDYFMKTGIDVDNAYQFAETLVEIGHTNGIERSQLHFAIEQFLHEEVAESCPACGAK